MKLHPRTMPVRKARTEIEEAVGTLAEMHELSFGELVLIAGGILSSFANSQMRLERHGNTETPADVAPEPVAPTKMVIPMPPDICIPVSFSDKNEYRTAIRRVLEVLTDYIKTNKLGKRWPCQYCGRLLPGLPSEELEVRTKSGQKYYTTCHYCSNEAVLSRMEELIPVLWGLHDRE